MNRPAAKPVAQRAAGELSRRTTAPRRAFSVWRALGGLLAWGGFAAAVVWGMQQLDAYVHAVMPPPACHLEWTDLPTWLAARQNEPILHRVTEAADLHPEDDVRDPELAARLGASLLRSPWVAAVKRVSMHPSGTIRIAALFREPFAFVETGGYAYQIDNAGVRLPNSTFIKYVDERYWSDWLRVVGVTAALPNEGEAWTGEDLAAALRLIQHLKQAGVRGEVPFRSCLRAIDVANFRRRENDYDGELRIRTVFSRSYIAWGLPPGEEYEVEAAAGRKLEMLRSLYTEHGGQFPDGWVYDVRGADGIRRWPYKDTSR